MHRVLVPAYDLQSWQAIDGLRGREGVELALGLHPWCANEDLDLEILRGRIADGDALAVGEIGLDYFVSGLDRAAQQSLFEAQLEVARDTRLPVILHVRKSHDAVLQTLRRIPVPGGICHAFNGSLQQAARYIEMGFRLGFGGMLTFERSVKLRALARELPVEALVLETDAPDMTVAQHRGERNSPEYLPYCLAALASVRNADAEELARIATANTREVLNLDAVHGV